MWWVFSILVTLEQGYFFFKSQHIFSVSARLCLDFNANTSDQLFLNASSYFITGRWVSPQRINHWKHSRQKKGCTKMQKEENFFKFLGNPSILKPRFRENLNKFLDWREIYEILVFQKMFFIKIALILSMVSVSKDF